MLRVTRICKAQNGKPTWPSEVVRSERALVTFVVDDGREFNAFLMPQVDKGAYETIINTYDAETALVNPDTHEVLGDSFFLQACELVPIPDKELVGKYEVSKEEAEKWQRMLDIVNETRAALNKLLKPEEQLTLKTLDEFLESVVL